MIDIYGNKKVSILQERNILKLPKSQEQRYRAAAQRTVSHFAPEILPEEITTPLSVPVIAAAAVIDPTVKNNAATARGMMSGGDLYISSGGDIDISADNIFAGGGIFYEAASGSITNAANTVEAGGGMLSMNARDDITNEGGTLRSTSSDPSKGYVYLTAGGDINNIAKVSRTNHANGDITETLDSKGNIEGRNVVLVAGNNILNRGSDITSTEQT